MSNDDVNIKSVLEEDRVFPPPADFGERVGGAVIADMADYEARWKRSIEDPEGYWDEVARGFDWSTPYSRVLEWDCPDARWFVGGAAEEILGEDLAQRLEEQTRIHSPGSLRRSRRATFWR